MFSSLDNAGVIVNVKGEMKGWYICGNRIYSVAAGSH